MPSAEVKKYQADVTEMLKQLYPGVDVRPEWPTMVYEKERMYSPRLDIAVGPFAIGQIINANEEICSEKYDKFVESSHNLIKEMLKLHNHNIGNAKPSDSDLDLLFKSLKHWNQNARCFLAIEIENIVTRKHLIGSAVNASALGRFGIIVAWTHDKLNALVRLREYLQYLGNLKKNAFNTTNLLILDKDQLCNSLENALRSLPLPLHSL